MVLDIRLHVGVVKFEADETLHVEDGVMGVHRGIADKQRDVGWGGGGGQSHGFGLGRSRWGRPGKSAGAGSCARV